jgi:hypothetical protein
MTEEREWARKCIRMGFKVLGAFVGCLIGLALVRWLGWW